MVYFFIESPLKVISDDCSATPMDQSDTADILIAEVMQSALAESRSSRAATRVLHPVGGRRCASLSRRIKERTPNSPSIRRASAVGQSGFRRETACIKVPLIIRANDNTCDKENVSVECTDVEMDSKDASLHDTSKVSRKYRTMDPNGRSGLGKRRRGARDDTVET